MKEIWNRFKRPNLGVILGLAAASFLFSHNSIADGTDGESSSPHVWSANMMMATESTTCMNRVVFMWELGHLA